MGAGCGAPWRLQVFRDPMKGWCLRTLVYIPSGAFVMEYVAERLTPDRAAERHKDDPNIEVYLMDLEGKAKKPVTLPVDTVVVCAGQESDASLEPPLRAAKVPTFKIGGAHVAAELDAKRAIDQATRLAVAIETAAPDKVGDFVAPLGMSGWLFQKLTAKRA